MVILNRLRSIGVGEVGRLETYFFKVEMTVSGGSAMGGRGEGRLRRDSQVCSMGDWTVMTFTGMGKQPWESRMYLSVGKRLNLKDMDSWVGKCA